MTYKEALEVAEGRLWHTFIDLDVADGFQVSEENQRKLEKALAEILVETERRS